MKNYHHIHDCQPKTVRMILLSIYTASLFKERDQKPKKVLNHFHCLVLRYSYSQAFGVLETSFVKQHDYYY